jgi:hypothetical protein
MTPDEYVISKVGKYSVNGAVDPTTKAIIINPLVKIISDWAGSQLEDVYISGSRAKGTAIKLSSDIDLFISLKSDTTNTLKEIYTSLYNTIIARKITARKQNVSIGIDYLGHSIDLVPGKKCPGNTNDHNLYRNKVDSWTKTNVINHINLVKNSGRTTEIMATKIWRRLHNLDFPSIYLELSVLEALYNKNKNQPASNFMTILGYLRDSFVDKTIKDPSNTNNTISDELYKYEKEAIAKKAKESALAKTWDEIIW